MSAKTEDDFLQGDVVFWLRVGLGFVAIFLVWAAIPYGVYAFLGFLGTWEERGQFGDIFEKTCPLGPGEKASRGRGEIAVQHFAS